MDPSDFPSASEFYVVEKTIEVVVSINGKNARIRIDALNQGGVYSTKAYIEAHLDVQPSYPRVQNVPTSPVEIVKQWVDYDLPWTHRSSADDALKQALGFLEERCS